MAVYTVHVPPAASGERALVEAVVLKEGFSWRALLLGPFWLLRHRLWLALALYVALLAVSIVLVTAIGLEAGTLLLLFTLVALWFACEANEWRRWKLERRGYKLSRVVDARARDEAEIRAIAGLAVIAPGEAIRTAPVAPAPPRRDPGIIGLFPDPERRR